jgi:hypothetical protein
VNSTSRKVHAFRAARAIFARSALHHFERGRRCTKAGGVKGALEVRRAALGVDALCTAGARRKRGTLQGHDGFTMNADTDRVWWTVLVLGVLGAVHLLTQLVFSHEASALLPCPTVIARGTLKHSNRLHVDADAD